MKRNPTSDDLFKKFHGYGANKDTIVELQEGALQADYNSHPDLAKLGDGIELHVGENIGLKGKDLDRPYALEHGDEYAWCVKISLSQQRIVDVAGEPNGKQIYFVKGDQDISLQLSEIPIVDPTKELITLGPCVRIAYLTTKDFDHRQPTIYFHAFGEESGGFAGDNGFTPTLLFNRIRRRLYLVGGVYHVEPDGIVD